MHTDEKRVHRSELLFGKEGQEKLKRQTAVVVGGGGLGAMVIQQVAYLWIGKIIVVDHERVDPTNLNRYVTMRQSDAPESDDPEAYPLKVDLAVRLVREINNKIPVEPIPECFPSERAIGAIRRADVVFGCVDNEGSRLILNDVCRAFAKTYFDLASDIEPGDTPRFGGRVFFASEKRGCIYCSQELDREAAEDDLRPAAVKIDRDKIYGVSRDALDKRGPSVISINGVIASLAVTEYVMHVTGIRLPIQLHKYQGSLGVVTKSQPDLDVYCYYCDTVYGHPEQSAYAKQTARLRLARPAP